MNKSFVKRLFIVLLIFVARAPIQQILFELKSSGQGLDALYYVAISFDTVIFPICVMLAVFYAFSSLVDRWGRLTVLSLILGFIAPVLLHFSIQHAETHGEPMASMAYVGIVLVYCGAASLVYILGAIVACVRRARKKY